MGPPALEVDETATLATEELEEGIAELLTVVVLAAVENSTVEVETVEPLVVDTSEESWYISNRFPAPQYSMLLPGHMKLQSPGAARIDPVPRLLPQ